MSETPEKTVAWDSPIDQAGFTIIENALLMDPSLSNGAKVTYLMLGYYARRKEECWPGQARLSASLGVGDDTLRVYLKDLQQAGLVTIKRRGLGKTNLYRLHRPGNLGFQNGDNPGSVSEKILVEVKEVEVDIDSKESIGTTTHLLSDSIDEIVDALNEIRVPKSRRVERKHVAPVLERYPEVDAKWLVQKMGNYYQGQISRVASRFTHWMEKEAERLKTNGKRSRSETKDDLTQKYLQDAVDALKERE